MFLSDELETETDELATKAADLLYRARSEVVDGICARAAQWMREAIADAYARGQTERLKALEELANELQLVLA